MFGGHAGDIDFRGQFHVAFKRAVIDLKREDLDPAAFAVDRLGRFSKSPQDDPFRFDRQLDRRFLDASEIDTNSDRLFAPEGIDGRLSFVGGDLPQDA